MWNNQYILSRTPVQIRIMFSYICFKLWIVWFKKPLVINVNIIRVKEKDRNWNPSVYRQFSATSNTQSRKGAKSKRKQLKYTRRPLKTYQFKFISPCFSTSLSTLRFQCFFRHRLKLLSCFILIFVYWICLMVSKIGDWYRICRILRSSVLSSHINR